MTGEAEPRAARPRAAAGASAVARSTRHWGLQARPPPGPRGSQPEPQASPTDQGWADGLGKGPPSTPFTRCAPRLCCALSCVRPLSAMLHKGGRQPPPERQRCACPDTLPRGRVEASASSFLRLDKDHCLDLPRGARVPSANARGGARCSLGPAPSALGPPWAEQAGGQAVLTCYVGAGAVVGSVLHQSVVARQLLWFTILCPRRLRALG